MTRAHAEYNWRRSRAKDTQRKAGRFYEHLMAETLGCEISPRGSPEFADIHSINLDIRVEVKSRGDANSFELRMNQVNEYKLDFPTPVDHTLYALVPWRASRHIRKGQRPTNFSEKTQMISLLRNVRGDEARNIFWAEHVQTSYLLDLRVITAIGARFGTRQGRMVDRNNGRAISIGRRMLTELFGDNSFAKTLEILRLQPSGWAKGVYPLKVPFTIDGQRLTSNFTLVTVLRKKIHTKVAQHLGNALTLV